jgi:bifunctional DNase/RNase
MNKVKLTLKGLRYSEHQTGAYVVVLAEEDGHRSLPIVIGVNEAQSIAIALEKEVTPPRPLTHDLFKNTLNHFEISIEEVVIVNIKDGVFFAQLACRNESTVKLIDSRPSDAIALAIRFNCPIYASEDVLNKAGIIQQEDIQAKSVAVSEHEEEEELHEEDEPNPIESASQKELDDMMMKAIANEDYELAARIRDEIEKRKK